MVNNDCDKLRSFSRFYMTLFRHRTCTYLHGRAERFVVLVSNGQVAALSDWACYRQALASVRVLLCYSRACSRSPTVCHTRACTCVWFTITYKHMILQAGTRTLARAINAGARTHINADAQTRAHEKKRARTHTQTNTRTHTQARACTRP